MCVCGGVPKKRIHLADFQGRERAVFETFLPHWTCGEVRERGGSLNPLSSDCNWGLSSVE